MDSQLWKLNTFVPTSHTRACWNSAGTPCAYYLTLLVFDAAVIVELHFQLWQRHYGWSSCPGCTVVRSSPSCADTEGPWLLRQWASLPTSLPQTSSQFLLRTTSSLLCTYYLWVHCHHTSKRDVASLLNGLSSMNRIQSAWMIQIKFWSFASL